jgi:hypothetical protein
VDAAEPPRIVSYEQSAQPEAQGAREAAPELELGAGPFLMSGGATGAYMGVTPFLIDELGESVSLRPSLVLGESVPDAIPSILAAARFDTCVRVPGNYAHGAGIQLDLCGGADAGFSYVDSGTRAGAPSKGQTVPYVDIGPSAGLRAEVGRLAVMLRAVAGLNVAHDGYVDSSGARVDMPLGTLRLELDFSWLVHADHPRRQDDGTGGGT